MPRRKGKHEVTHVGPSKGSRPDQQPDERAGRRKPKASERMRTSEAARKTPYGGANRRKKTS